MKKARQVEVEEGQHFNKQEFEKLFGHAKNSLMWYVTQTGKTIFELKTKMYDKGFPKEDVFLVHDDGTLEPRNFVEEGIQYLRDAYLVDDEEYAMRYARRRKAQRFGPSRVRMDLQFKGVDSEFIENALEEVFSDTEELKIFLEALYEKMPKESGQRFKEEQKLVKKAAAKGWNFEDILSVLGEIKENEESFQ